LFSPTLSGDRDAEVYVQIRQTNEERERNNACILPRKREKMNIYVGNMPYSMSEEDLKTLFGTYGSVSSARLVTDRETGRAKGFGFVEMGDASEAQAAIEAINGMKQGGRELVVNEARPREERPRREGGFGGGRDGGSRGGFGGGRRF
jgi:RNA recognition motif-containing protein